MSVTAAFMDAPANVSRKPSAPQRKMTLDAYFKKYRDLEDGFKYEFNHGIIEKTPRTMTPAQSFILRNLHHNFTQTKAYAAGGDFQVEIEMHTSPEQIRKPDICYRSARQIASGDFSISEFAVEIISPNDKIEKVMGKMREYFAGGMKVLWHIFPEVQEIHVYTSPRQSKIFSGEETVGAAPAIPDFTMKAADIFVKPAVPVVEV